MNLFEVGRLCLKIAGRDAGRTCVVVEQIDDTFVIIDGDVRRKKVNIKHLEPLAEVVEMGSGSGHDKVVALFKKRNLSVWERKAKSAAPRIKRVKKNKKSKSTNESKSTGRKKSTTKKGREE